MAVGTGGWAACAAARRRKPCKESIRFVEGVEDEDGNVRKSLLSSYPIRTAQCEVHSFAASWTSCAVWTWSAMFVGMNTVRMIEAFPLVARCIFGLHLRSVHFVVNQSTTLRSSNLAFFMVLLCLSLDVAWYRRNLALEVWIKSYSFTSLKFHLRFELK